MEVVCVHGDILEAALAQDRLAGHVLCVRPGLEMVVCPDVLRGSVTAIAVACDLLKLARHVGEVDLGESLQGFSRDALAEVVWSGQGQSLYDRKSKGVAAC